MLYILSVVLVAQFSLAIDVAGDSPGEPGVYYLQHPEGTAPQWIRLDKVSADETNTKGMKTFIDTGGFTNLNMNITYRGATAQTAITNSTPSFFIRDAGASKDLLIVRLAQTKDRRVIRTSPFDASRDNKAGFRPQDIFRLNVEEQQDGSAAAVPERPLPAGEYLLMTGSAVSGYDFSIFD